MMSNIVDDFTINLMYNGIVGSWIDTTSSRKLSGSFLLTGNRVVPPALLPCGR